jgi:RNA polymerase sigma-70 factor (ECF subfamily)
MALNPETRNITAFSDTELVEACRKGNLDAFEWLVEKYQNVALALALSYIPNFHDAQEIVQEAFLNAYCKLAQLSDTKRFKGWLCTIVTNLCRSWLRRQTKAFLPLDESAQMTISRLSIQHDRQERLRASVWTEVDALPEKYRMVILLYYMNDYSYSEMAEFLDLPVSTVKGRLQQARLKLKREFQPAEKEELRMSRVNSEFSKRVRLAAYQIAKKPVKETVSLDGMEHLVLFFGVQADVEVRQHDGDMVEITGTKHSLGGAEKEAQESVSGIQFYADATGDYWEDGPHQVILLSGTDTDDEGTPYGRFVPSSNSWQWIRDGLTEEREPMSSIIRAATGKTARVTIGREKEEDIVLSREAYTGEVQRIFSINYSDPKQLHCSTGYVDLVILLPPGKCLTVIRGRKVFVSGVRNDINLISCRSVDLKNVEGTVCLHDSHLAQARDVKGKLVQYFHRFGGGEWGDPYSLKRSGSGYETKLQRITSEIHIDVGKVLIEASEVEGKTLIKNRFGTTRLYQTNPRTDGACEIQSSSGDVLLFLSEKSIGEVSIATKTLCGEINYSGLKEMSFPRKWNTPHEMYVGTVRELETADVQIQTESGNIRMEKMVLDD